MVIVMLMVHGINSFQLMKTLLKEISSVLLIQGFLSNDDDHHLSANVAY
jgi:hypothetical protein